MAGGAQRTTAEAGARQATVTTTTTAKANAGFFAPLRMTGLFFASPNFSLVQELAN